MMTPEEKEYHKKYRLKHKEKRKEYDKKYRLEHKEEAKEYFKKYTLEHKEETKERHKKYRLEHKEYFKKYRLEHPEGKEERKERQKKYRLTPSGKEAKARGQINYHQKHPEACVNLPARVYVTKVLKPVILLRDSFTCQLCGAVKGKLVIHHIIPVKYDKDDRNIKNPENLITLCPTCHKKAHKNNWTKIDIDLGNIFSEYTKSKKKTVEEPVD